MKTIKALIDEILYKLKKGKRVCLAFLLCCLLGVVVGLIIAFSNGEYVKLLTESNKVLIKMINGTASMSSIFWKKFITMLLPIILIYILGLNYYLNLLNYIFITYQGALFIMTFMAIISVSGFAGVISSILIYLPLNILFILALLFASSISTIRCKEAKVQRKFSYNLTSSSYLVTFVISLLIIFAICIIGVWILPLFIKNSMFLIF